MSVQYCAGKMLPGLCEYVSYLESVKEDMDCTSSQPLSALSMFCAMVTALLLLRSCVLLPAPEFSQVFMHSLLLCNPVCFLYYVVRFYFHCELCCN